MTEQTESELDLACGYLPMSPGSREVRAWLTPQPEKTMLRNGNTVERTAT